MAQYPRKLKRGTKWWYKFDFNRKTYTSKAIYPSKKEARNAENVKFAEVSIKTTKNGEKPILSLLDAINNRLTAVEVQKSKTYYKENKRYFKMLIDCLGAEKIVTEVKKKEINDFLLKISTHHKTQGNDNYTVNSMLRIYKALFNHAIDEYELEIPNPCKGIKPFSVKKKLKYIPPDQDIDKLIEACDDLERLLIVFVKESASRINEALRFKGVDLFQDYIVLYTRKSKNSDLVPRTIPRPECLQGITLKDDERLFARWNTYPKFLENKVKELGQKRWSWHSMRHRKASLMSSEGKPLFEIMSFLGHSNLATTQGYLQLLPK